MSELTFELAWQLHAAKKREANATLERQRLEAALYNAICAELDGWPCEPGSSCTVKVSDRVKVAIKRPTTYAVNAAEWAQLAGDLDEVALAVVEHKPSVVAKAAKWMQENDPATWARMSRAITIKEGKASLAVTIIEEG